MAKTNRQRIDEALLLVAEGFGTFVVDQLQQHWGDSWRDEVKANARDAKFARHEGNLNDPDYVLWLANNQWRPVFYKVLSETDKAAVAFLRDTRREWAHNNRTFTADETHRVVDMSYMLLSSCNAVEQAAKLDDQRQEVLRLRFEEQTKRAATRAAESLDVEGVAAGGLRSWREVVEPHQDVASGAFQLAEFAADFREVAAGTARPEYLEPVEFFNRTFVTRGLHDLLVQTLKRLNGVGGNPVVDLQTSFGGGKTHSLLAVYHLAGHPDVSKLAGISELAAEAGVTGVPNNVNRAVIIGNDLSARGAVKEDGTQVNTMWGELAWQLGGRNAYDQLRPDDEQRVSPRTSTLRDLLAEHAPCVVLIDEWIAYARQLWNRDDLPGGTLDVHMTFAQSLTEAAKSIPNCLLVIAIPASDAVRETGDTDAKVENTYEIGGVGGAESLRRLRVVVGRTDNPWQPAQADESFEIVRRRLFTSVAPENLVHRDVTCRRFSELYQKHTAEFPREVQRDEYQSRMKEAYPIHPEVFDRLYQDWSTLERFQRTRGVLRLMATVVHNLWVRNDRSPMILPSSIPLEDPTVFQEITKHLDDNWKPVVDQDIAGPGSLPVAVDAENTTLGRVQAAQRVARSMFLGSAPTANRNIEDGGTAPNRGIEQLRITLGSAFPGDTPAVFGDALRRLTERARFLNHEGSRYWFATQPTVSELARQKAQGYEEREVIDDLSKWVARETDRGDFARVHRFPGSSADVEDDQSAALVILGPENTHARKSSDSPAAVTAMEFTRHRGSRARQFQNMLLFMAPDANRLPDLLQAVRMHKAWQDVYDNRDSYNLDQHNTRLAVGNIETWTNTIAGRITETYVWLMVPRQDLRGPLEIEALKVNGSGTLAARATRKTGDNDLLITRYAPSLLRMELDRVPLWRDGQRVTVSQVWEDFSRYPYLPRLRDSKVLIDAIVTGPRELNLEQDGFGYADSYDEASGRFRGLVLHDAAESVSLSGVLAAVSAALQQWQADKETAERAKGGTDGPGSGGGSSSTGGSGAEGGSGGEAQTASFTRFYGETEVDPQRAARDVGNIANEILAHFVDNGTPVKVTLSIQSTKAEGFDEPTRRLIEENARTLGFGQAEFGDD